MADYPELDDIHQIMMFEKSWREQLDPERLHRAEQLEAKGFIGRLSVASHEAPVMLRFRWSQEATKYYEISDAYPYPDSDWLDAFDQASRRVLRDY